MLQRRAQQAQPGAAPQGSSGAQDGGLLGGVLGGLLGEQTRGHASNRMPMGEAIVRTVARSVASTAGRQITNAIIRGVLGGLTRR